MSTVVSFMSSLSVGATFMDWSVHFLAGKSKYYFFKNQEWINLVDDPTTELNAHGHRRNHPQGIGLLKDIFKKIPSLPDDLYSVYPTTLMPKQVIDLLGLDVNTINIPNHLNEIENYRQAESAEIFNLCCQHSKSVYIYYNSTNSLFQHFPRRLDSTNFYDIPLSGKIEDSLDEFTLVYNKESLSEWEQLNLSEIWDKRERLALNIRPGFNGNQSLPFLKTDFSQKHFRINAKEFWNNGEDVLKSLMNYLELEIDPSRLQPWVKAYNNWKPKLLRIQNFIDSLDEILDCIVNGYYYQLPELTFIEETIIQHFLIYKYNLNFKTWQLTKFPTNTIELHQLLEPNIHPLVHTYQDL